MLTPPASDAAFHPGPWTPLPRRGCLSCWGQPPGLTIRPLGTNGKEIKDSWVGCPFFSREFLVRPDDINLCASLTNFRNRVRLVRSFTTVPDVTFLDLLVRAWTLMRTLHVSDVPAGLERVPGRPAWQPPNLIGGTNVKLLRTRPLVTRLFEKAVFTVVIGMLCLRKSTQEPVLCLGHCLL